MQKFLVVIAKVRWHNFTLFTTLFPCSMNTSKRRIAPKEIKRNVKGVVNIKVWKTITPWMEKKNYDGRREERSMSWRELSLCIAALNSSKVTFPSLLASIKSNISSNFPGSVISAGRHSSGKACSVNWFVLERRKSQDKAS